jgi:hypothetical protein
MLMPKKYFEKVFIGFVPGKESAATTISFHSFVVRRSPFVGRRPTQVID